MSLYSALRSGVSGLFSNAQRMGMISDNIANVNTSGYKRVDAQFSSFVTSSVGGVGAYTAGGVLNYNVREIGGQGTIEPTNVSTDMAISGNGYFVVARSLTRDSSNEWVPEGDTFFTRSGEFRVDENGNLRNASGYYLLSWPRNQANTEFDESNEFSSMRPVNISNQAFDPTPTSNLALGINLTPQTLAGADSAYTITQDIVDRQGTPRTVELSFEKAPSITHNLYLEDDGGVTLDKPVTISVPNTWRVYAKVVGASIQNYNADGSPANLVNDGVRVPIGDIAFDSAGRLSAITAPGAITQYYRTSLPLSTDTVVGFAGFSEPGSVSNERYMIPNTDQTALNEVRDILVNAGVPVGGFAALPTVNEILNGIDALQTESNPLAMLEIMRVLNDVGRVGGVDGPGDFVFEANRAEAGLPTLDQGIDQMFNNVINPSLTAVGNGATFDGSGAPGLGATTVEGEFFGGRIVSGDGDTVRIATRMFGGVNREQLQNFSTSASDRIRLVVDYDNSGSTDSDISEIDISLGTLSTDAFDANNLLNRSNLRVPNVGAGLSGNDGLTQYYDDISTLRYVEQNGRRFATLQSVDVSEDGIVSGFYDDGQQRDLFKVPLVTFANPNGLRIGNGNVFQQSAESGIALTRVATTGGAGRILNSAREGSAVDLAEEFSNMIITQRAYSANTKIITTTDSMLEELTRSIR